MSAQRGRLDAALAYASVGWPVFPLRPGGKEPALPSAHRHERCEDIGCLDHPGDRDMFTDACRGECGSDGHGFYDATTDPARIAGWWRADPARNVGIATGAPGPDVVDVDNHGPDDNGFGTLNHLKRAGLVDGYHAVVQTPSRGIHLYYRGTDQGNGSVRGYRIDFRSRGGYIVAPPSATPAGQYVVVKHAPVAGAGTVSWDAIRAELASQPQAAPRRPERQADPAASLDRLVEWTASRQPGDRNFPLFWAAKEAHLAGQLDGEAVERFVDAARRSGLEGGEREARRTIASAQRHGDRQLHPAVHPGAPGRPSPAREPQPRPFAGPPGAEQTPAPEPAAAAPAAAAAQVASEYAAITSWNATAGTGGARHQVEAGS